MNSARHGLNVFIRPTVAPDRRYCAHVPTLEDTIAQLEAVLESTHDGILVVDLHGRLLRFNREYLKMFRLDADDLDRGGSEWLVATIGAQPGTGRPIPDKARE